MRKEFLEGCKSAKMSLTFTKSMHDAALHIVPRYREYGLIDQEAYEVRQLAEGYVGACDVEAAHRGAIVAQNLYRKLGKACPF